MALGLGFEPDRKTLYHWDIVVNAPRQELDIYGVDKEKKVVDVKRGVPITTDPKTWKVYSPKEKCRYILETPFDIKIKIGDKLRWQSL